MASSIATWLASDELPLSRDALREQSYRVAADATPLPLPGAGDTLARWQGLAQIAAIDVCLAKILEAHYDAIAILAELGDPAPAPGELWAVWAAEPPTAVLTATTGIGGATSLTGFKAWCSGADVVSHALVTARDGDARVLCRVALAEEGVSAPATDWNAVGMQRVVSGEVNFDAAPAACVGAPGGYLSRPGFWHGGAGIAACWFGATTAIADTLRTHARAGDASLVARNLGMIDLHLAAASALLRETAMRIDAEPAQPHVTEVLRARSFVERVALDTIDRVGRALGPGPLCLDHAHAQRCADLSTFVRQSHADRDWQALGEHAAARSSTWTL